jgi:hypothetical protein
MMEKKLSGTTKIRNADNKESKKVIRFHLWLGGSSRKPEKYTTIPIPISDIRTDNNSFSTVQSCGSEKNLKLFRNVNNPYNGIVTIKQ